MTQSIPEILERMRDAFVALDREGRFAYVNGAAEALLRRSRESLLGRVLWEEFPEMRGGALEAACRSALREGIETRAEERFEREDLWIESRVHPSDDGLDLYLADVSARHPEPAPAPAPAPSGDAARAREALRRQEAYFRALTEYSSDLIAVVEPDGRIRYQNPAAIRVIGYSADEMTGVDAFSVIHPDDLSLAREVFSRLLESGEESVTARLRFRHADGGWRVMEAEGRNLLHDEAVRGLVINSRDVTERVRAEEELRALFAAMQDVILVLDREGRYLKIAPTSQHLLYRPSEEMLGRTLHEVLPEGTADALLATVRASLAEGRTVGVEYRLPIGAGERWFHASVSPLSPETVVWIARDVTVARRAADALRASERRYRNVFEQSRDTIYITRPDGTIVDVNPAAEELFGLPRAEMLGLRVSSLYADPAERERVVSEVLEHGSVRDLEVRLRRASGEEFDALISATVVREGGEAVAMQGTIRDVTEQKEAERKLVAQEAWFRSLTQNALDIITVLDAGGRIRYATPSGSRALGYPDLRGTPLVELIHPEDRPLVTGALGRLLREGTEPVTVTARVRASDGSWQVHEGIAQSLLHDPAVRGVVVNSHDVTEQRQLESQLRQAQKMEAVGRLAGGVAHDFNNVLMAITGFAALLEGEVQPTPDATLFLTEIHKATERAASLTRQLLAFGRKQSLHPKLVNLNSVLEGAGGMLRRLIREDVELVYRLSARLGQCRVDPHQVEQVLVNLVVNATDALPHGGSIEIATRNRSVGDRDLRTHPYLRPGAYVCLTVRDTGHGMDAETLARVFDPFFTTKEQGKGTGLGLSMVYGIIKQSGGYVWGESQRGAGSTFTVLLPRTPGEEAEEEDAAAASGPLRPGQGTVLLAEDEDGVRLLARLTLRRAGYEVLEASDGEEALRVARAHDGPIDLLLTDVVMPRLGGFALAERLRADRPSLRVVFMSGYAGDALPDLHPDEHRLLPKPITPEALTRCVREVME